MSATSAPYGFRAIKNPTGTLRKASLLNGIASGYSTALYTGQPVALDTNGTLVALAAGANSGIGVFAGCIYTPSGSAPVYSPTWAASSTYVSTEPMYAFYYEDPAIWYAVQCAGSLAATAIGDQTDVSNATANGNGYSQATVSASLAGAGSQGQFRIVDLFQAPGNAWGDAYTQVVVQFARHQYVADKVAI